MKYIVQVEISVEAEDDDAALFWIKDALTMYGLPMSVHRWIQTTTEGEQKQMTTTTTPQQVVADRLEELGNLIGNELQAPQQVGAKMIDDLYTTPVSTDTEDIAHYLYYLTDIQVRDYALGLINPDNAGPISLALGNLIDFAPEGSEYKDAPAVLLAALNYELGNDEETDRLLNVASDDYALKTLLKRVFAAGWPAASFAQMRNELHPKVVAGIFDSKKKAS